jgi:NAD-dependent deacetylase
MSDVAELVRLIREEQPCVVLTGAGVSTESGIPDFRSPSGMWADFDPLEYATAGAFRRDSAKVWRFYAPRFSMLADAVPNRAHAALAELEELGLVRTVVTQNIDLLHERAGSRDVIEVHGSIRTSSCLDCRTRYPLAEVVALIEEGDGAPRCSRCGTVLKPDVVFFDELLPAEAIDRAFALARQARLLLVVGSSLEVHPVAGLPLETLEGGGTFAIVNESPTALDGRAAAVVRGRAGDVLADVVEGLRQPEGHRLAVVPYDAAWPRLFAEEAERIRSALGANVREIEHMGSTAVQGLAAKPVLDISIGLETLELRPGEVAAMERLGYEYMGEYGIPGRLFFRKGGVERTHHVHAVEWGGEQWHRHRAVREYLRAHPDEAERYGEHKSRVAAEAANSDDYWERKQPYVDALFARAWSWYEAGA